MRKIDSIAIVDDDDIYTYLATKVIERTNLVDLIKVFGNGLEMLNFLKENSDDVDALPEVILLDLNMPVMNGWQFLEEHTKLNPRLGKEITIYICSSSISPDDISRAKAIGEVTDYIIKPITKENLVNIIKNL